MRTMYDAINPELIPLNANPQMVAGYVNGKWPSFNGYTDINGHYVPSIRQLFPNAVHVSIAVNAQADAQVLDCETSDATPQECPGWATRQRARGQEPTIYCNQSNTWLPVQSEFVSQGVPQPQYWVARYDGVPTLPLGTAAKQFGGVNGKYDLSVVTDHWLGIDNMSLDATDITAIKTAVTQDLGLTAGNLQLEYNEVKVILADIQAAQGTLATLLTDAQADQSALATLLTDIQDIQNRLGSATGGGLTKQDLIDALNSLKITAT